MRAVRPILTSLAAAALGAGAALLFAPQSGERTRRQIRHKTEDLIQNLREELSFRANDAAEQGRSTAHHIGRRFRARLKLANVG